MGSFFTSTQIYNPNLLDREQFINFFCEEMKKNGYVTSNSDESEVSYILRFSDECKWVTLASEAYEQGNQLSQSDTGRIAKMLKTVCINTTVIDSDCATLDLYDKSGKRKDSLIMGRADDYFGDDIPEPIESVWSPLLEKGYSWRQLLDVQNGDYVFVEEGLSEIAPIIGIAKNNIVFTAEDAKENDNSTVILDFKIARPAIIMSRAGKEIKPPKSITLNAAFKQIIGKALEPFGFKVIKGRHPYIVRVINNEILHIITFRTESPDYSEGDKALAIMGGIATVYRKKITLDQSPIQNYIWFNYMFDFYEALTDERDANILGQLFKSCYYSDKPESLISAMNIGTENLIKYVLPVMDKINDIDSSLDYMRKFKKPCNYVQCTKICTYYPDEDEAFLYFLSKYWQNEQPDFLSKFSNDADFHEWVTVEIEKRKTENQKILKALDLIKM
jgi:hypothetical protein